MNRTLIIFFLSIFPNLIFGQFEVEYILDQKRITQQDGLLSDNVHTVFEDNNGLIWIGSNKGLQRFNGSEYTSWTGSNSTQLIKEANLIFQDDSGWYWIWNYDHFVFLDPLTDKLTSFEERFNSTSEVQMLGGNGELISSLKAGCVAAVNNIGKLHFPHKEGGILTYESNVGWEKHLIPEVRNMQIIHVDSNGTIWLAGRGERSRDILHLNSDFNIINSFKIPEGHKVYSVSENQGKIYLGCGTKIIENKLFKVFEIDENGSMTEFSIGTENCIFFKFIDGNQWLRTKNKISIRDGDTGDLLLEQKLETGEFSTNEISAVKDSRGRVWFAGRQGIIFTNLRPKNFNKFLSSDSEEDNEFNNAARGIIEIDDLILVNLEHSFSIAVDKETPNSIYQILDENIDGIFPRSFYEKENGHILLGTTKYISIFDTELNLIDQYLFAEKDKVEGVWSMHVDSYNQLWAGTNRYGSLYKLNQFKELEVWVPEEGKRSFDDYTLIQNIFPCDPDNLWLCTSTGLYKFNVKSEEILDHYSLNGEEGHYLPATNFYYLYEDSERVKWIGTDNGIIKWNYPEISEERKLDYEVFDRTTGLSNNVIYAVYEDDYGKLWVSSDEGIMSLDKETSAVKVYGLEDGISQSEFNRISHYQSEDGTIYFGGLNGITSFHPDNFNHKEVEDYELQVLELDVFDEDRGLVSKLYKIRLDNEFTFHPSDRFFRLKFAYPFSEHDNKTLFGWQLEGVDHDWNFQEENTLQFGVLPYGKNTLRIKALDHNGGWSKKELIIRINVVKPFYLRTGNIIVMLLVLIAIIALFFRQRTRILEKKIDEATEQIHEDKKVIEKQANDLKKLDELKSRFFANVSHELRTPLSLMIGPIKTLLKKNQNDEDKKLLEFVKRNSVHLNGLVNEILDLSKLENNKVELKEEPIRFYSYLNTFVKQFYSIGSSDSILFKFHADLDKELDIYLDKNKFEKVINNFLSNALKFTPKDGEIALNVSESESEILVEVRDTGRGISKDDLPLVFDRFFQSKNSNEPAEGGTGIGLSMCKELAHVMNGSVRAESALGEGSKFYFKFPKKQVISGELKNKNSESVQLESENALLNIDPNVSGSKILVVEDNKDLRDYYQIILSEFEVMTACNGQEALEVLRELENNLPELIISDLMMPIMDGLQLVERLKSTDNWRNLPVIMLTAKTNRFEKITALRFGIDDYITKPFDEDELKVRISNLLVNYKSRVEFNHIQNKANAVDFISSEDSKWLARFEAYVLANLDNSGLSVITLSEEFGMSERTLLRHLKRLTGLSTVKYLQEHKLNVSRKFLESGEYKTVSEVAYKIGFKDPKAFARSFRLRFGSSPSKHIPK